MVIVGLFAINISLKRLEQTKREDNKERKQALLSLSFSLLFYNLEEWMFVFCVVCDLVSVVIICDCMVAWLQVCECMVACV